MPPSQMAGPVVRLPFQGPQRPTKPGIEAYQNFVLNIDAHDKAVATAQLASLAETSGQVPTIHDNYRPVFIIDGRRIESSAKSNPKKEAKRTRQDQTQSPRVNTPKTRLTDALLPEALFEESETAGEENKANSHAPDVDALIDALGALPTDGNALPMSLSAEEPACCCSPGKDDGHSQSTESAVAANADTPGLPVDGIVLDTVAGNPIDDIAGKGKGKASLDLATLTDQPTSRSLTASRLSIVLEQDGDTQLQQCSNLDNWTETLSLEALGMEQLMQRQEQSDTTDLHTPAAMRPENEGDEKTEEVPINL
ncbi:hypothetical protein BR93DRAFT_967538 [Coniochaeta sp. PMI_546]|nr:hypothetical protein BR93DRAFT_967538 [Coniochaeta sp. PMI_546]